MKKKTSLLLFVVFSALLAIASCNLTLAHKKSSYELEQLFEALAKDEEGETLVNIAKRIHSEPLPNLFSNTNVKDKSYTQKLEKAVAYMLTPSLPTKALNFSNSNWMEKNAADIGDLPVTRILFPGSHDAGTYYLSKVPSPDFPITKLKNIINNQWVKRFKGDVPIEDIVILLSRTQSRTLKQQLMEGIRFIDIRFCEDQSDVAHPMKVCHGMFGTTAQDVFQQFQEFASANPGEIFILQLRIMPSNYTPLQSSVEYFQRQLGLIAPWLNNGDWLKQNYSQIIKSQKRILTTNEDFMNTGMLIAKDAQGNTVDISRTYPVDQALVNVWPNTDWDTDLVSILIKDISQRYVPQGMKLNEFQWLLTPSDVGFAALSLKKLAHRIDYHLGDFVSRNPDILHNTNVIIADFYEHTGLVDLAVQQTVSRGKQA